MTDVIEVVAGKGIDELDALIAAAQAEKTNAKESALNELVVLADAFKVKCEAVCVKAKSYFVDAAPAKATLVYANPLNASETYSKGPRPQWLKDLLVGIEDKKAQKEKMSAYLVA